MNKGKKWTQQDERILADSLASRESIAIIALKLGRSEGAIRSRVYATQNEIIDRLAAEGKKRFAIAVEIERITETIASRLRETSVPPLEYKSPFNETQTRFILESVQYAYSWNYDLALLLKNHLSPDQVKSVTSICAGLKGSVDEIKAQASQRLNKLVLVE
jgi:hypothetical protein